MIDVSCILINFNTSDYTIPCVQSIMSNSQNAEVTFEIVIVDNASAASDYKKLQDGITQLNQTNIKVVRSNQNTGFGAGNMLGVQYAGDCRYYAFINNDTLFTSQNTLSRLKRFMEDTADAGICSPQMLDEDGNFRVTIDHYSSLGREILRRPLLEKLVPGTYLNRKVRYEKPTVVQYVQGSFLFCDAKMFQEIGGFDTNLFLYYEESDLTLRMVRQTGKKCYLIPQLEYIHYKGASTTTKKGKNISIKIEQKISLIYHTRKHYGWLPHKILLLYYSVRYFFSSLFTPAYWKLWWILIQGAPLSKSLKQRQKIQNI